jgi:lipoprotein-anchoring transpeptidase ErfK/SrfK
MDRQDRGMARRVTVVVVGGLALLGVAFGGVLEPARADDRPFLTQLLAGPTTTTTKPKPKTPVPAWTNTVSPNGEVQVFDAPNGRVVGTAGYFFGYDQWMPMLAAKNGWLQVRLPERPNGKTGWIRSSGVSYKKTPYRIVMDRSSTTLTLYKDGWPQWSAPIGMGKASTPTPLGRYYVSVIDHDDSPGYGAFQLVTNAHSEAIQDWQGLGDALIAMHGPINSKSDKQIGSRGAYLSNGCIRMHLSDLNRLSAVPLGTPVDIFE